MGTQPTLIQSVQRALHVMEALAGRNGRATVKQLARDTGLALPTTYHLVRTLAHEGYISRLDDGSVVMTSRLGELARDSSPQVAQVRAILAELRDLVGAVVYFARVDDGEISVSEIVESSRAPRVDLWVGMHDAAHATALGKAILTALPEDLRRDYLDRHRPAALTANTLTDVSELLAQMHDNQPKRRSAKNALSADETRVTAVDNEEYSSGVSCVASALVTPQGGIAAVGLAVPTRRLAREPELRRHVASTAGQVERALSIAG